jgi:hypothetical protein
MKECSISFEKLNKRKIGLDKPSKKIQKFGRTCTKAGNGKEKT